MQKSDVVEVFWDKRRVGRVSQTKTRLCVFEYDTDFIDCGSSVSPLELPLKAGLFTARPAPFLGNFGVFDDSLPDGWGALVLSRYLQKKGRRLSDLTIPQRLALVGSGGRGALEFVPDESVTEDPAFADLQALARESREILNDRSYNGEGIEEFQRRGGSSGGARPKIFLKADGTEWLVKFRAQNDPADVGVCEYQYSLLAKACGVEMPATRLFENRYFAAERFDRRNGKKIHAVSAAGLLCADYRLPSLDYLHLFQLCCFLTHSEEELWKIFRLMTFNFLIGNKDDHAKNFAFLCEGGQWRFAPAFDLLPSDGMNGYRTTSVNDAVDPKTEDLIKVAERAGLKPDEAWREFDRMAAVVLPGKAQIES